MAVGLLEIDEDGNLRVRNRLYERVFTARWANENLPIRLRVPAIVVGALLLLVLVPFWYTQWLPRPYMRVLASPTVELETASEAYRNFRSFPGHADIADRLYRGFLTQRASVAERESDIYSVMRLASGLPGAGRLPETLEAQFWDRRAQAAKREERRARRNGGNVPQIWSVRTTRSWLRACPLSRAQGPFSIRLAWC
jgi:hypothetical protein